MSDCIDPVLHDGCRHASWREAVSVDVEAVEASMKAADYARADLRLESLAVRFFEPGPSFSWAFPDPHRDMALFALNREVFDPLLKGCACPKFMVPLPTVWVRSGLSPAETAAVTLHEAKHVYQDVHWKRPFRRDAEIDAKRYEWRSLPKIGFKSPDGWKAYFEDEGGGTS